MKEPIIKECEGCAYAVDGYCQRYINPAWHWRYGICPASTHIIKKITRQERIRIGQQRQQKQPKLSRKQQATYARMGK